MCAVGQGRGRLEEAELIRASVSGDQMAFAELVDTHRARLWSICWRTTGSVQDAEDALQDTLFAAWHGLATFRADARFSTWLFRIASNAALACAMKRQLVVDTSGYDVMDPGDLEAEVARVDQIQRALEGLSDPLKVTFVLRHYGDLTYQEIADYLDIPVQTVRSRLSRARDQLRQNFDG